MTPDVNDPLAGPFWQAAANSELRITWCERCDRAVWYPRADCPQCHGELHWRALSGDATLLSWSEVMAPINPDHAPPYITALVCPLEAPEVRLVTRIVDCEADKLRCDMPVRVCFRTLQTRDDQPFTAPVFHLAEQENTRSPR